MHSGQSDFGFKSIWPHLINAYLKKEFNIKSATVFLPNEKYVYISNQCLLILDISSFTKWTREQNFIWSRLIDLAFDHMAYRF